MIPRFLTLPDALVYAILRLVAPPCETASVACHRLALLSRSCHSSVTDENGVFWDFVLGEYSGDAASRAAEDRVPAPVPSPRRCKRLRRSAREAVREAHLRLCERSDAAHLALTEMTHRRERPLTLARLRALFPRGSGAAAELRVNQRARVGGTLLIECCRARFVEERAVLSCVRFLVTDKAADVNVATGAGPLPGGAGGLTPLCIAAARGMATVVGFLVSSGADPSLAGQGRFRLFGSTHASVHGKFTPRGWVRAMAEAEAAAGVPPSDLAGLLECARVLDSAAIRAAA